MNKSSTPSTLLVIARETSVAAALQADFVDVYANVLAADSLQSANACLQKESVSMILCESGVMQETTGSDAFAQTVSEQSIMLVLHNPQQVVGVKFQRISDQSFYCLQTSCCGDLLPLIAAPAKLIKHPGRISNPPNRPCFVLPMEAPSAVIHSMY